MYCMQCARFKTYWCLGVSCFSMAPRYDISQAPVLSLMVAFSGLPVHIGPAAYTEAALAVQGDGSDCLQASGAL